MVNHAHEYAAFYLEQLREGRDVESALFSLMEADRSVLPVLIAASRKEENLAIRAEIVHCIWQHRYPEVVGFLAEVLSDAEPRVWQEGLDGLVAIGGNEAIEVLEAARTHIPTDWIDEALAQMRVASAN